MSHPQHHLRAFLEDGPYAGETISVEPNLDDHPPEVVTVEGGEGGNPHTVSEHVASAGRSSPGLVTYRFVAPDLDNAVWRYRFAPGDFSSGDLAG